MLFHLLIIAKCSRNGDPYIAGHLPSEGRVGEGKGEGRIGFFESREGKQKEGLVQKILLRRKNEGRCWF